MTEEKQIDAIRLLLLDAVDSIMGGLLVADIQMGLFDKGMELSTQKIATLIRHRGRNIKLRNIAKGVNLYYMDPSLDVDNGTF